MRSYFAGADRLDQAVRDLRRAHLRFQVVGGDLRRGHQYAAFAVERLLATAAEEKGHVGILLGLGDAQLRELPLRDPGAEHVVQRLRRKGAGDVEAGCVLRGHHEAGEPRTAPALEAVEGVIDQRPGHLPRAIGAEVHEQHRVAVV
jgi:hypothetical protein